MTGITTTPGNLSPLLMSVALVFSIFCLAGCRGGHGFWGPPGPLKEQQANAIVHDPFPQSDIGPSDNSARPLGYQQPLPEPVRNRLVPDAMPWLGR